MLTTASWQRLILACCRVQPVTLRTVNFSSLSRGCYQEYLKSTRRLSLDSTAITLQQTADMQLPERFRTDKSDPAYHSLQDVGLFYTIPKEDFQLLCAEKGNPKSFRKRHREQIRAFNEAAIMVRRPALEVINYMKHADYTAPVQRYLLYGETGTGKSLTLQHITHYCLRQGWLIVPTPRAADWIWYKTKYKFHRREELLESQWKIGRWDHPVISLTWLENFRIINKAHLSQVKTSKEYVWTKRERTEAGVPLGALVDQGIARAKISTDVIGCIMRELRTQPEENLPRVLVTVDNVNALFRETGLKALLGAKIETNNLTFVHNLKKLIANTWKNGAVVMATVPYSRNVEDTFEKLGHEAFDVMDPHIPVEVPNYTDNEVLSQLAYYEDRRWLGGRALTADGKMEIMHLACNNPEELVKICIMFY